MQIESVKPEVAIIITEIQTNPSAPKSVTHEGRIWTVEKLKKFDRVIKVGGCFMLTCYAIGLPMWLACNEPKCPQKVSYLGLAVTLGAFGINVAALISGFVFGWSKVRYSDGSIGRVIA